MPHLAGMFDLRHERPDLPAVLARLGRLLGVAGVEYLDRSWHDRHFGAVNLLNTFTANPDQPAVSADGQRVLLLEGDVYNVAELRPMLASSAAGSQYDAGSTPRLCLGLYEALGDAFVANLNGQFNIAIYDQQKRQLKLFNDRLGYRPLYYTWADGRLAFGNEKKAVIALGEKRPGLDPLGVLELFTFSHNLEDRTVFTGVTALAQGAVLTCDAGGLRVEQYWRPEYKNRDTRAGLDECVDEFARRLRNAMALRCQPGRRLGIFLSGGLDSRAVAAALAEAGGGGTSFTFSAKGADDVEEARDVRYARELAGRLNLDHHELELAEDHYFRSLPRVVWRTECAISFHYSKSMQFHRYVHPRANSVFNGHFGDAISGGHMHPQQYAVRSREGLVDFLFEKRTVARLGGLRGIFRQDFIDRTWPQLRQAVLRTLSTFDEDRLPLLANLWDFTQRQRRFTFCSPAVDRYLFERITPFVDRDLVDWCLRMPTKYLFWQRAYKRMIVDAFPAIRDVGWARTGGPVPRGFVLDFGRQLGTFALKKARRVATRVIRSKPPGAKRRHAVLEDPRLRARLDQYVASDAFPSDLFDRDAVRQTVTRHFDGGENSDSLLATLLTLAEGTRLFLEGSLEVAPDEAQPDLSPAAAQAATA